MVSMSRGQVVDPEEADWTSIRPAKPPRSRQASGVSSHSEAMATNKENVPCKDNLPKSGGPPRKDGARSARPRKPTPDAIVDMDSLRDRVAEAQPGTIRSIIAATTFRPREAAFTALIVQCAKSRDKSWEKAVEVFEVLRATPGVSPNCISYSAVISACSSAGQWEQAESLFRQMEQEESEDCAPNTITYSSLISACERGGQFDRALQWFERMQESGVKADAITFSALVSACTRKEELDKALKVLDLAHNQGLSAPLDTYVRLLEYCGRVQQSDKAVELFLSMQMAHIEPSRQVLLALFDVFEASNRPGSAAHLLTSCQEAGIAGDRPLQMAALRCFVKAGSLAQAEELVQQPGLRGDAQAQQLLRSAKLGQSSLPKPAEPQGRDQGRPRPAVSRQGSGRGRREAPP